MDTAPHHAVCAPHTAESTRPATSYVSRLSGFYGASHLQSEGAAGRHRAATSSSCSPQPPSPRYPHGLLVPAGSPEGDEGQAAGGSVVEGDADAPQVDGDAIGLLLWLAQDGSLVHVRVLEGQSREWRCPGAFKTAPLGLFCCDPKGKRGPGCCKQNAEPLSSKRVAPLTWGSAGHRFSPCRPAVGGMGTGTPQDTPWPPDHPRALLTRYSSVP